MRSLRLTWFPGQPSYFHTQIFFMESVIEHLMSVETCAVLFSIGFIIFNARTNILSWPLGIIASILYIIVFFRSGIYGDMILQVFYIGMGFYGWITWINDKKTDDHFHVNQIQAQKLIYIISIGLLLSPLFGFVLDKYTDSNIPYWDAFTTVFSFIATWMMAKKYIQNWHVWVLIDSMCIAIYLYKELFMTAFLFLIYTLMAIYGLIHWRKIYHQNTSTNV